MLACIIQLFLISGVIDTFKKLLKLIKNPILITKAGSLKIGLMLCMLHMLFALSLYADCAYIIWNFSSLKKLQTYLNVIFVTFYSRLSCFTY